MLPPVRRKQKSLEALIPDDDQGRSEVQHGQVVSPARAQEEKPSHLAQLIRHENTFDGKQRRTVSSIFKWAILGIFFLYFRLFNSVDRQRSIYILPMTGFEPGTSGFGSKSSTN